MLSRSPLVMVLVQVRFPKEITVLGQYDVLDKAMLSAGFPMADTVVDNVASLAPNGALQHVGQVKRREYGNVEDSLTVSVGKSFVSMYAVDKDCGIPYEGHELFLNTFSRIMNSLGSVIGAVPVSRLGYRYVDALHLKDALDVIARPCLGLAGMEVLENSGSAICSSMVEAYFDASGRGVGFGGGVPQEGLHLACGTLAAGAVIDPAIPICEDARWVIDVDSYSQNRFTLETDEIQKRASELANRAHSLFFNHVVTDEFVKRYR